MNCVHKDSPLDFVTTGAVFQIMNSAQVWSETPFRQEVPNHMGQFCFFRARFLRLSSRVGRRNFNSPVRDFMRKLVSLRISEPSWLETLGFSMLKLL